MPMIGSNIQTAWQQARKEMAEECGLDKTRLMAMEIFCLQDLAKQILSAVESRRVPAVKKPKRMVRR
jgi:hypothetical protein